MKQEKEKKGTGFKSIYNIFKKAIIKSRGVICTLIDEPVEILWLPSSNARSISERDFTLEKKEGKKKHYPIPIFKKAEEVKESTVIELYLNDESNMELVKKMIFNEISDGGKESFKNAFAESKVYLFLDRINKFYFNVDGELFDFNRKEYIENNYFKEESEIILSEKVKDSNPYWKEKEDIPEAKRKITILFPKNVQVFNNKSASVYCTLPISDVKLKLPFYVNIPLLELDDSRTLLANNVEEWNRAVLTAALTAEESAFSKIFCSLNKEDSTKGINLQTLHQYFPYEYLEENIMLDLSWKECLLSIPFIRTTKGGESCTYEAYKLKDWANKEDIDSQEDKFIFLPDYMYWWFGKKEGLDGFGSEIPFVYYDDVKIEQLDDVKIEQLNVQGTFKKIFMKISNLNPGAQEVMGYFKRTEEGKVGKILLDTKEYIEKKSKWCGKELSEEECRSDDFCQWLRIIRKSKEFIFLCKNQILFGAFFNYCFDLRKENKQKKYHCIGNRELKIIDGKIARIEEIDNYINICPSVEALRGFFFGNTEFKPGIVYAIKDCFYGLLESPYVVYKREWKGDEEIEISELRTDIDEKLLDAFSPKLLFEYTEMFFSVKWSDKEGYIRDWIAKGNILYGKTASDKIVPLTSNTYFSSKEIEGEHIVYGICEQAAYLKNLDEEIEKAEFYSQNKKELIRQVIEKYEMTYEKEGKKRGWGIGAKKFLDSSQVEDKEEIFQLLMLAFFKNKEPLEWSPKFGEIMKGFRQEELLYEVKEDSIFLFYNEISRISQAIKDRFREKVSYEQMQKLYKIGGEEISLEKIVDERVYLLDCNTGNKALYCRAEMRGDNKNTGIIVMFGENAFGKMLREQFDCNEYSDNKTYLDMNSMEVDELVGWGNSITLTDENILEEVERYAGKVLTEWKNSWDKEWLRNILIERSDICCKMGDNAGRKIKWIRAQGYGAKKYMDKRCPICKSILISEQSLLKIGYVSYIIEEMDERGKNIHLPMLMCQNCYKSFNFAEQVVLRFEDSENWESALAIKETEKKVFSVVFNMYAMEEKEMRAEVTFLNRWLWYLLIREVIEK